VVDRFGRWFHVTREDLARVERWFEHSGRWVLTFGYFIPGVRHFTALVAGSSRLPPPIFARYAYSGAAIWSLTFMTLGWWVGPAWESTLAAAHRHMAWLAVVVVALAGVYVIVHRWWLRRSH
jgi:membrane protein DedA with SNARE-associated domain